MYLVVVWFCVLTFRHEAHSTRRRQILPFNEYCSSNPTIRLPSSADLPPAFKSLFLHHVTTTPILALQREAIFSQVVFSTNICFYLYLTFVMLWKSSTGEGRASFRLNWTLFCETWGRLRSGICVKGAIQGGLTQTVNDEWRRTSQLLFF